MCPRGPGGGARANADQTMGGGADDVMAAGGRSRAVGGHVGAIGHATAVGEHPPSQAVVEP